MGFGGFLKGLGKVALNVGPALLTGGASLPATMGATGAMKGASMLTKALGIAGKAAPVISGLAAGKQKGREAENAAAAAAQDFALKSQGQHEGQVMDRAGLDLKRRQFGIDSEGDAFKKAMQSAVAKNIQDVNFSGVPSDVPVIRFSGGNRPSAMGPEGRAAAALMNQKAMERLTKGEQFDDLPMLERIAGPEFKKPGAMENILGIGGMIGGAVNDANAASQQKSYQDRLLAAIESVNGPRGVGDTATKVGVGQSPVVTPPFIKPPTGQSVEPIR